MSSTVSPTMPPQSRAAKKRWFAKDRFKRKWHLAAAEQRPLVASPVTVSAALNSPPLELSMAELEKKARIHAEATALAAVDGLVEGARRACCIAATHPPVVDGKTDGTHRLIQLSSGVALAVLRTFNILECANIFDAFVRRMEYDL